MIVLKFGGSSVKDAARIRAVREIVATALPEQPVVVLSALGGVTDLLLEAAHAAAGGAADSAAIAARHREVLAGLALPGDRLDPLLSELDDLLRGIALIRELTPRTLDRVASYGERLSVRIVAAHLADSGVPASAVDAWELGLVSEDRFGGARLLDDQGQVKRALAAVTGVPVVTGFIAHNARGEITTLGRGGSDYTASALGKFADAREIQIWTDVDGVMSADPKLIPSAQPIEVMSFDEASEVAYYGAKVLHPATIQPAIEANIPVRVLNTYRPHNPGTLIVRQAVARAGVAKAVVHKRGITLVNVVSTRMLAQHGFLARIFDVFSRHEVVIDMVATSEVSVSVTVDDVHGLEPATAELSSFAEVGVERDQAIVCVVGHGMRDQPGVAARVLSALAEQGVNVRMISQGATRINIALIVGQGDVERAVQALHVAFFD